MTIPIRCFKIGSVLGDVNGSLTLQPFKKEKINQIIIFDDDFVPQQPILI